MATTRHRHSALHNYLKGQQDGTHSLSIIARKREKVDWLRESVANQPTMNRPENENAALNAVLGLLLWLALIRVYLVREIAVYICLWPIPPQGRTGIIAPRLQNFHPKLANILTGLG
jgi:hypothetical protein